MSTTNQHVESTYAMLNASIPEDTLEGVSVVLHALTESNLAIAYEQRTANQLTLIEQMFAEGASADTSPALAKLLRTTAERLDLK